MRQITTTVLALGDVSEILTNSGKFAGDPETSTATCCSICRRLQGLIRPCGFCWGAVPYEIFVWVLRFVSAKSEPCGDPILAHKLVFPKQKYF